MRLGISARLWSAPDLRRFSGVYKILDVIDTSMLLLSPESWKGRGNFITTVFNE